MIFILDIEAPASGTYKGAGPAVYTGKRDVFPEGCFVKVDGIRFPQAVGVYRGAYFSFRRLLTAFYLLGGIIGCLLPAGRRC